MAILLAVIFPSVVESFQQPTRPASMTLRAGAIPHQVHSVSLIDNQQTISSPSILSMTSDSVGRSGSEEDASTKTTRVDTGAIVRYISAFGIQMGLFFGLFHGLDALVAALPIQKVPIAVNFFFFYACALKSRILNPLNNQRPQQDTKELKNNAEKRNMPTWTPPGVVFPIMWLLIIGPLRAVSSCMVYQTTGQYATTAIFTLMAHLSIGDIWNTINNKERRYGTSVVGVLMVWVSAAAAAYQYYHVSPLAGRLLSLPLVWLTVASSLIVRTWQLNPDPSTGKVEPLIPKTDIETTITKLEWFET